jgi:hypothetical protein
MTESSLKTIVSTTQILQTPEDAELGARVRKLLHRVLDEVEDILEFGSPRDQLTVIKALLQPAGRLVGVGAGSQKEEARMAFESLMADVRAVVPVETLVTETGILDVDSRAVYAATHDQDEGDGTSEAGRDDW